MLITKVCYCSRLYFRCVNTLSLFAIIYNKQANPGVTWHLAKIGGGGLPPLPSQFRRPCRKAMRSANMDVSRRCHHPQSSTTSKPNPGVVGGRRRMALRRRVVAAAASVAWPQAEAIESSGQGEEEWGGKRRKKKREANRRRSLPSEPWMALLLLLYYTWIVVWLGKIVEF